MGEVRIGCSGWSYAAWRGRFYPEGLPQRRWLEHYASRFDTVEVNSTFYRLPTRQAVAGWVSQTPPGFVFAVKASRYLTHVRRLRDVADGLDRLRDRLAPMIEAGRLGPILWQLPPTMARDDEVLVAAIRELDDRAHAIEFRHSSWFMPEVSDLLHRRDIAVVVADDPYRPLPQPEPRTSIGYVRLHRGRRGRRGNYSETELDEWAERLRRWERDRELYVYFNNDWEGFAVRNALSLRRRLSQKPVPL